MTQQYPQKFAILHIVGGVVTSTKNLFLQEYDRKREHSKWHIKHGAV